MLAIIWNILATMGLLNLLGIQGWRGSVTMQCEICGINMWEWQEFTDKDGKYSKKVYVGKKLN